MQRALVALRDAATVEEQKAAIAQVQQIWEQDSVSAVLGATRSAVIWSDEVAGLRFNQETMVSFAQAYLR